MDGLLILKEVAIELEMSYATVKRRKANGDLPEPVITIGRIKWSRESIEELKKGSKRLNGDQ
jgi:predicted DNA-binding transcriptional regulator AlpA